MISLFKKKDVEEYKREIPKSVQKTIPYLKAFEDGIFEVKKGYFSKTIEFQDINYQIARQEVQEQFFLDYCVFLNSFDSRIDFQITIMNSSINIEDLEGDILIDPKGDEFDLFRSEYNEMLRVQIEKGRNDIKTRKFITISTLANDISEAKRILERVEQEIALSLKKVKSNTKALDLEERLQVLHGFYRGEDALFTYNPRESRKYGLLTKDLIAPDGLEFKRDYMMVGDKYARSIFLSDLPSFISDKIISEMIDFNFDMVLSLNIRSSEPENALRIINKQITGMESDKINYQKRSVKNGYFDPFIPNELKNRLEQANELLEDITNNNQKLFFVSILMTLKADSLEELNEYTDLIDSVARKYLCQTRKLNYQQEDALASSLPFGLNRLNISRTLTTESTAVFMPFTSQELIDSQGMYYGINAVSRNMIMLNRKKLKNSSGFILGTPGSGKSFSAKREMVNVLLNTDDEVLIIDPEREYTRLVENFKGEVIKISAGSNHYINPLDMSEDYADDEDPLILKSDFILSLCEVILGGRHGLNPIQKSIIDRSMRKSYQDYIASNYDKNKIPTLKDFHRVVSEQPESEAKDIAVALELYALGNQSVFANKTNIDINNRLVCFDIKDLGKQLKTMGMLIVLDAIWNRITENRDKGVRTWIYMDEIYLLFANEYSSQFLFELYKRARKWGGIPTGITQNVEDLLVSDTARSMLANSEFLMLLNQAPTDRIELSRLLNLSEQQLSYVTNSGEGEGVLVASGNVVPFVDKFPSGTMLYKMMTTKVDEIHN